MARQRFGDPARAIPLVAGRMFEPKEPPTNVIISEPLAARLWPNADPIGRRFRESPRTPWYHVIGVVNHVRTARRDGGSDALLSALLQKATARACSRRRNASFNWRLRN
jgi:hypothetical protein